MEKKKNDECLIDYLQELMDKRIEILNEFIDLITQHFKDIKQSEKKEEYEDCKRLYQQIPMFKGVYVVYLNDVTVDSVNKQQNNEDIINRITEQIKIKVLG